MRIGVVGLGFVGLVTAAILADQGHSVTGIDTDRDRIKSLRKGESVIYEPGLDVMLAKNKNYLKFSNNYDNLKGVDAVFVCVATPDFSGKINLEYVFSAVRSLKDLNDPVPVALKSTVIPGTATRITREFGVRIVSNPEFLREGSAVQDTLHPDRIVIGGFDQSTVDFFADLWSFTDAPIIKTTNENAELMKYASNAFLATKISFINEIANLCEVVPRTDVKVISEGMGLDKRIAPYFLQAGLGYGGSCFPKDTKAISSFAKDMGVQLRIIDAAMQVNNERVEFAIKRIEERLGPLKSKKVCVLGLTFKDNTSDIRESKSWELIKELQKHGVSVITYDPVVNSSIDVPVATSISECVENSDICIIATEWKQFSSLAFGREKLFIDLRGILGPGKAKMTVGRNAEN